MEGIIVFLAFIIFGVAIYGIVIEIKSKKALFNLGKKYENGLDLGCERLEELANKMSQVFGSQIMLTSEAVEAKEGGHILRFFVSSGRVYVEYPVERFSFSRYFRLFQALKRNGKIQKAIVANQMMDRLALTYQPQEFIRDDGSYVRAKKIGKRLKFTFILAIILGVLISVFAVVKQDEDDKVKMVRYSYPKAYPNQTYDKVFENSFSKPKWEFFDADNGKEVVEFTGFLKDGEEKEDTKFYIQFIISDDGEDYKIGAMKIGDHVYGEDTKYQMLEMIFEGTFYEEDTSTKKEDEKVLTEDATSDNSELEEKKDEKTDEKIEEKEESKEEADTGIAEAGIFVFPDSDRRYLGEDELASYNKGTLRVARNEIYARHGRIFKDEALNQYFNAQSWYVPLVDGDHFDEGVLNEFERQNLQSIKMMEDYVPDGEFNPNLFGGEQVADANTPQIVEEQTPSVYRINYDISYEDLLRRGVAGMPVYIDGTVRSVFDNTIFLKDVYEQEYHINDKRINKTVILEGDYISVYGQYMGPFKSGEVSPDIDWIE